MFQHNVYSLVNRQGLFAYVATLKSWFDTTAKFMVVVTSLFNPVISSFPDNMFYHACMNMGVALSRLFQQRLSLFVHQAMNSLFQHAWTSLSTTMFKLSSSTWINIVHACQQAIRSCAFFRILLPVFIVMCTAQLNNGFIFASHVAGKNKTIIARCHELRGKHHDLRTATRGLFVQSKSYRIWCLVYNNTLFLWRWK